MLKRFDTWPDVLQHVRSGGMLYYVIDETVGPCQATARVRTTGGQDTVRLWVWCPDSQLAPSYRSTIADSSFLGKLYRWETAR